MSGSAKENTDGRGRRVYLMKGKAGSMWVKAEKVEGALQAGMSFVDPGDAHAVASELEKLIEKKLVSMASRSVKVTQKTEADIDNKIDREKQRQLREELAASGEIEGEEGDE